MSYSEYGEVATESVNVNSMAVGSWTLSRDNVGRIESKEETVGGDTADYDYAYDELGRLTQADKGGSTVEVYGYGRNGQRTFSATTDSGLRSYTYDAEDRLTRVDSADTSYTTYEHDADGFLTSKTEYPAGGGLPETTTFEYSSRGELLRVMLPDDTEVEYEHDPLGRRVLKKVNDTPVEKYLWSGMTELLAVYDGSGNLKYRFEGAKVETSDGSMLYMLTDQVGTIRALVDASGHTVRHIEYDSFGNILADSNQSLDFPLGFAGGLYDEDTGLVRFGYRDYDPETGRWTAKDPLRFASGDANLYGYCLADPIGCSDCSGLSVPYIPTTFPQLMNAAGQQIAGAASSLLEPFTLTPPPEVAFSSIPLLPPGVSVDANIREAQQHAGSCGGARRVCGGTITKCVTRGRGIISNWALNTRRVGISTLVQQARPWDFQTGLSCGVPDGLRVEAETGDQKIVSEL